MTITVTGAHYSANYNPVTANNGGGYWQFRGSAAVALDSGVIAEVELDDSSCGDFGERWDAAVSIGAERYEIHVDCMDGIAPDSAQAAAAFEHRYGADLDGVVSAARRAIDSVAYARYRAEHAHDYD